MLLAAATAVLLGTTAWRTPDERPRALGLMAVLASILVVALSVGYSRSGIGPGNGWCSRYITIAMPLIGVVYFAWLLYGPATARRAIHIGLLVVVCGGIPAQADFARAIGTGRRAAFTRVEGALQRGLPLSRVVDLACPDLFGERDKLRECFQMLKEARVGRFGSMSDDRHANRPDARSTVR